MNDTHTHAHTQSDPFVSIQTTEESAEKTIEKAVHKNAEALSMARSERETELKTYEDELKNEGMQKLKSAKEAATERQIGELRSAQNEAENLKLKAKTKAPEAIELIIGRFKHSAVA